jgi:hypothetical protein
VLVISVCFFEFSSKLCIPLFRFVMYLRQADELHRAPFSLHTAVSVENIFPIFSSVSSVLCCTWIFCLKNKV